MKNRVILTLIILLSIFLRLWKITEVPVSLFGDELDVGYQAYSILKTGRDYNGNFMPLHFHSQAEWRTPLYLYSAVPTVAIFGISPLGVRLPAAFFGILGVWAMYLMVSEMVNGQWSMIRNKKNNLIINNQSLPIVASFLLAISPWHIQYSRAAFEVTELLAFLLFGIYFFFRSLKDNGKYLWLSVIFFVLTPWVYSSAKLFTPLFMLFILMIFWKEILSLRRKEIVKAVLMGLVLGVPLIYSTIFGGGSQRFGYISVFTDPTMEGDVGFARLNDASVEGVDRTIVQKISSRVVHNKYTFWGNKVADNYFSAFSTNFLFNMGDLNRRHNIEGMGEFYKADAIPLLLGIILFFAFYKNTKAKLFLLLWILLGVFPSSITRDGGNHATRLILILPPLIFLISYGIFAGYEVLPKSYRKILFTAYCLLLSTCFYLYSHNYWIHNPWYSERWWHAGFKETVQYLKSNESKFDKIIFSNANEPPLIFFAGWYHYPPDQWQKGFEEANIDGFSPLQKMDKYYFGQMEGIGIYELSSFLPEKTMYVATEREVGINLIMEPQRVPPGLVLLKAVPYPSGEPAFYIFTKSE
ncbi:MAG: hypothetical protein US67_C0018G0009 [Candidatus Woesebacteria bacterium GW2011_GWD1_38_10]|uniref:Glycosyltransferase RgtA/B/C/D-like domain-containing protein n=1 Tax=Candidatus Woesebacteria bacterium GW2011_GWD1_38_10 TaxID=1618592 RepID=A0A0G0I3P8_9BACT|nr:MAG: hypothetical protein US67_C0018G0009 [Candidatus Woesebacteria bacterium GW2011_GWD1_38_10]